MKDSSNQRCGCVKGIQSDVNMGSAAHEVMTRLAAAFSILLKSPRVLNPCVPPAYDEHSSRTRGRCCIVQCLLDHAMQTARRAVPLRGRARHEPVTALRFDLQGVHSIGNRLHSSLSIHLRLLIRCRISASCLAWSSRSSCSSRWRRQPKNLTISRVAYISRQ